MGPKAFLREALPQGSELRRKDEADETWSKVSGYFSLGALARSLSLQFQSLEAGLPRDSGILGKWLAGSDWRAEWTQSHQSQL